VPRPQRRLRQLVELVRKGQRALIARSGVTAVEIVRHRGAEGLRQGGQWGGRARIADDFDAPMPEVEELFGS